MNRRRFIRIMTTSSAVAAAGCARTSPRDRQTERDHQQTTSQQLESTENSTPIDTTQPQGTLSATPESNTNEPEVELPGKPVELESGELPIYQVQPVADVQTDNLTRGVGQGNKDIDVGQTTTEMSFSPIHEGTGDASGYATGTYRTAWTAPKTGVYTLAAEFERSGTFKYDIPSSGDVMASFDVNTQIALYDEDASRILAEKQFPIPLRSSPAISSREIAEFLIETGVTAIIGYSLGLGLVARVVLKQIVDELVELDDPGSSGSEYDVATSIPDPNRTALISARFKVLEGEKMIFELSPMVSWAYTLQDTRMRPQFDTGFEMKSFTIRYLE